MPRNYRAGTRHNLALALSGGGGDSGGGAPTKTISQLIQEGNEKTLVDNPNYNPNDPTSLPYMEGEKRGFWGAVTGKGTPSMAKQAEWQAKQEQQARILDQKIAKDNLLAEIAGKKDLAKYEFELKAGEAQAARNELKSLKDQEQWDKVAEDALKRGFALDDLRAKQQYDAGQAIVNRLQAKADYFRKLNDDRNVADEAALRTARAPLLQYNESVAPLSKIADVPGPVAIRTGLSNFIQQGLTTAPKSEMAYELMKQPNAFRNMAFQPEFQSIGGKIFYTTPASPSATQLETTYAKDPETGIIRETSKPGMKIGTIPVKDELYKKVTEEPSPALFSRPLRTTPTEYKEVIIQEPEKKQEAETKKPVEVPLAKKQQQSTKGFTRGDVSADSPLGIAGSLAKQGYEGTKEMFTPALEMLDQWLRSRKPFVY